MEILPPDDPRVVRIEEAISGLSEHFDSVRIFATVHDPEGGDAENTHAIVAGRGNCYASYGIVREWLVRQDEKSREAERNF